MKSYYAQFIKGALIFFWLIIPFSSKSQDTFSIVAIDANTGEVGVAGASCVDLDLFAVPTDDFLGELFPGQGAIATQASYVEQNQINARMRMQMGQLPSQIISWLVANDVTGQPQIRQYGVVGRFGSNPVAAAHTGSSCLDEKGHITGPNYSIQGNIILSTSVLDSMEARFLNEPGDLACKLMAAMQGANIVGADSRCASNGTSSLFAFLKVAQPSDTFGNPSFLVSVRTSDGDSIEPIDSLQTLFDLQKNCQVVGVNNEEISEVHIFPNPAAEVISVKLNGKAQVMLFDIFGKEILSESMENHANIDLRQLPKGQYFIRISKGESVYTETVIHY